MKYLKSTVLIILLSLMFIPNNAFSEDWKLTIVKRGGKVSPCGDIYFRKIIHNFSDKEEHIECIGKGNKISPKPIHDVKEAIIRIESKITKGISKGVIYDLENLMITEFSKGKISNKGVISYKATITVFDTLDEFNEYKKEL